MAKEKHNLPVEAKEKGKKKARKEEEPVVEEPAVEEPVVEKKKDKKKKKEAPPPPPPPPPKEESSEESSDEDDEEEAKPAPAPAPKKEEKKEEEADEEEEEEEKPAKIEKEEEAEEEKPAKAESEENTSAFVANIAFTATEDDVRQFFADCGEITNLEFAKGKAIVTFSDADGLKKALELSEQELAGRPVYINVNQPGKTLAPPAAAPSSTLFLGNLSFNATEDSISEAFGECGNVKSIRLITDRETGKFKGFGYIEFETEEAAKAAHELNGTEIDGRPVRIDFAQARPPREDGGRGGFGGRGRGGRGGFGGRGGRGGFGDRGGRGGFGGRGGRGGFGGRGGRGGFGDRGGRGRGGFGGRGRGGPMRAGSAPGEYGKKTTFGGDDE